MAEIVNQGKRDAVFREKNLMNVLSDHPHIIKLLYTAKTENELYFILEVAANGNLEELLKDRTTLENSVIRGYSA